MRLTTFKSQLKEHFFYSCLLLFLSEKQAVTHMVCKSWLLESNFLPDCDVILTLHSVVVKFHTVCCSLSCTFARHGIVQTSLALLIGIDADVRNYIHLLVRDVSNRWQMYEKVLKRSEDYGIIFEKSDKAVALSQVGLFSKM